MTNFIMTINGSLHEIFEEKFHKDCSENSFKGIFGRF